MHDETLDRTTNATGKVSESTFEELKEVRLRDYKGDITDYRIPTLEEVIRWSRGKTILNLDRKDVPLEATVALIKRCGGRGAYNAYRAHGCPGEVLPRQAPQYHALRVGAQ